MSEREPGAYYRQREQQERQMASTAANPQVASIHVELADRYWHLRDLTDGEAQHPPTAE